MPQTSGAKALAYNKKARKCDVCKIDDQSLQYMVCEFCEAISHTKCLNYGDREYRIWSTKNGMCFICEECRESPQLKQFRELKRQSDIIEQFIYKMDERIQSNCADTLVVANGSTFLCDNMKIALKKITEVGDLLAISMKELKECIQSVAENSVNQNNLSEATASYAGAVKAKPSNKSLCVIEPKNDKQDRATTKTTVMNEIDPVDAKVSGIRGVGKSGIGIVCENEKVLEKVKEIAEKKLGEKYSITVPKPMYPRLKISGLSESIANEELVKMLIAQNELKVQENEIKVVTIHATKRKIFYDAIVEVPPQLYKELLQKERVYIGWSACYVCDGVSVRRCVRCCGYGHLAKDCKEATYICQFCSGKHKSDDCDGSGMLCINCRRANTKFHLKLSTNHYADSPDCGVFQRELKRLREKIVFV